VRKLKDRVTYANATATLALFVALGGSSYAVSQLPRNSVGSAQIKRGAVGSSELRRSAVSSRAVRDRSVALQDLSLSARSSLRGATGDAGPKGEPGPAGPPAASYRAVVNSGGGAVRGNPTGVTHQGGSGLYSVAFERDVSACVATASLSEAQNGPTLETPPAGRITLGLDGSRVAIRTFAADGSTQDLPFSVIVAC